MRRVRLLVTSALALVMLPTFGTAAAGAACGPSFSVVPSPNVGGNQRSALESVSCTSPTSCVAVGFWQHTPGASLAEKWDGSSWKITPVPNFTGWTFSRLNSVSCLSATNCFAVGSWAIGSPIQTLVAR